MEGLNGNSIAPELIDIKYYQINVQEMSSSGVESRLTHSIVLVMDKVDSDLKKIQNMSTTSEI